MRIVEPQRIKEDTKPVKKLLFRRIKLYILLLIIVMGSALLLGQRRVDSPSQDIIIDNKFDLGIEPQPPKGTIRTFTGNEMRILYDNLLQKNVLTLATSPSVSGNSIADARIREIATTRGYKLRRVANVTLPLVDGYPLQLVVHQPWLDLKAAAKKEGIVLSIVSAYRSVDTQRSLFLSRLSAQGVAIDDVAAGKADKQVDAVLITSSIPGYSKHHSGYTMDWKCAGFAFEDFKNSGCYTWLSANNYQHAKEFGFLPSYPVDADSQGPDPEAWEYVYVGKEVLVY